MAVNENSPQSFRPKEILRNWRGTATYSLGPTISWTDTRTGVNVPDYARKIAMLESASSDYTIRKVIVKPGTFMMNTEFYMGTPPRLVTESMSTQTYINELPAPPVDLSRSLDIAMANFLSDAVSKQRPLMGGVVLGELKETLNMLRRPAVSLRNGLETYLKQARRILNTRRTVSHANSVLADTWLEYKLGWMPLVADIKSACDAYSAFKARPETMRAFGKATESSSSKSTTTTIAGHKPNYFYYLIFAKTIYKTETTIKGVFKVPVEDDTEDSWMRLAKLSGVGTPWDIIPTVWELVPYSFIVDYFTTIGNVLNGLYAITFDWVWTSQAVKSTCVRFANARPNAAAISAIKPSGLPIAYTSAGTPSEWERFDYVRSIPALRVPMPRIEVRMDPFRWTTLYSLATNLINRPLRLRKGEFLS